MTQFKPNDKVRVKKDFWLLPNPTEIGIQENKELITVNTYTKKIREEFEQYLGDNWDDRETLFVADWWLSKHNLYISTLREKIEKMKKTGCNELD